MSMRSRIPRLTPALAIVTTASLGLAACGSSSKSSSTSSPSSTSTGGPTFNSLAALCGHKAAVEKGTTQAADATAQSAKCKAAGKPGVNVLVFPDQNGANLALSSGRGDVGMADSPVAAYQVKQSKG